MHKPPRPDPRNRPTHNQLPLCSPSPPIPSATGPAACRHRAAASLNHTGTTPMRPATRHLPRVGRSRPTHRRALARHGPRLRSVGYANTDRSHHSIPPTCVTEANAPSSRLAARQSPPRSGRNRSHKADRLKLLAIIPSSCRKPPCPPQVQSPRERSPREKRPYKNIADRDQTSEAHPSRGLARGRPTPNRPNVVV